MGEEHTRDLDNVQEGDNVTLHTSEGETLEAECLLYEVQHADPRSGEVRETTIWQFDIGGDTYAATVLDGLRSSADDPDFPQHTALWSIAEDTDESLGYVDSVQIHGNLEA